MFYELFHVRLLKYMKIVVKLSQNGSNQIKQMLKYGEDFLVNDK